MMIRTHCVWLSLTSGRLPAIVMLLLTLGPSLSAVLSFAQTPSESLLYVRQHNSQEQVTFTRLSVGQDLRSNTIACFCQDAQGFLWIGTANGLVRYDGYTFVVYNTDPDDPQSVSHDDIQSLYEDTSQRLWVGTQNGLNRYDRMYDRFIRIDIDPDLPGRTHKVSITALIEDALGNLWIGTDGHGLFQMPPDQLSRDNPGAGITHYQHDADHATNLSSNFVTTLYVDTAGTLWIGTLGGGLNRFDARTLTFERYQSQTPKLETWGYNTVTALVEDAAGMLWLGTRGGGLKRLARQPGSRSGEYVEHILPATLPAIHHQRITALYAEPDALWVGTDGGGLLRLRLQDNPAHKGAWEVYRTNSADPGSLSQNIVTALYQDLTGVLWVGTDGGGLNKYVPLTTPLAHYQIASQSPYSQVNNIVTAVYEDRQGERWIGTYGGGLYRHNPVTNSVRQYLEDPQNRTTLPNNIVLALIEDQAGVLWVGTRDGGLASFDRETETFTRYQHDPDDASSVSHNKVRVMFEDRKGALWVGTEGGGLNRFDRETKRFTHYQHSDADDTSLAHNDVWDLLEDAAGNLWIGTDAGLDRFDPNRQTFYHYVADASDGADAEAAIGLSSNHIRVLYETGDGALWIGTRGGGLNKFQPASGAVVIYTARDGGLPGDVVYGIVGDRQGALWISTAQHGLVRFDPAAESWQRFTREDGLQGQAFNVGACYQTQAGEILFGGMNGFNAFYAERIHHNRHEPPIVITQFALFNKPVTVGGTSPLSTAITTTDKIVLSSRENVVSFEFAALDFQMPEQNQYAYMLEGLDPDWVYAGMRRFVTYSHLAPGRYVFRVKGSNNAGVWNQTGAAVILEITPPLVERWWFRLAALACLLGGTLMAIHVRLKAIEHQKRALERLVQSRTAELEARQEQLCRSEQRYRAVVEDQTELICRFQPDGTITFANDAYCRYFGSSRDQIVGQTFFNMLPPEDQRLVEQHLAMCILERLVKSVEYRIVATSGDVRWQQWTHRAIFDEQGALVEFQAVGRDITDRKQMEFDVHAARDVAEQARQNAEEAQRNAEEARCVAETANRAKSEFLANMSHELRTPLNAILGYAQLLSREENVTERQFTGIQIIRRSGEHLLSMINEILDLAKIEAHTIELDPVPLYLHEFLIGIVDMINFRAEQKGLHFMTELAPNLPEIVYGDARRLRQILLNLLSNAIKFTETGTIWFRVQLLPPTFASDAAAVETETVIRFEVQDTGIGVPPEQLDTIFLPFQQVGERRFHIQGTGLGLSISQELAQMMGSCLLVESAEKQGSRFWFDFRARAMESAALPHAAKSGPGDVIGAPFRLDKGRQADLTQHAPGFAEFLPTSTAESISSTRIALPPPEQLEILYDLINGGDLSNFRGQLDGVAVLNTEYLPFVAHCRRLADSFRINDLCLYLQTQLAHMDETA